ncbi:hypothetical protein HNO83_14460 [Leifsonia sp. C5G2]|nr:hypothetical protein [Leifsonia sp. C5G2]
MSMSNTQPTEPLPPRPEYSTPPPAAGTGPAGTGPAGAPAEPFYKRHGLAFAISTLVLSVVILLGLFTAGAFAVANVVTHMGERAISRVLPQGQQPGVPGMPGMPGRPGDGDGNGGKGNGDGNGQMGHVLVRGTIASISGDTWTVDRESFAAVKVKVDSSTVFGVPGQSASKSDFASGDEVVVIGTRSGGTVTATRVLKLTGFPTRPPSTPGPATPGS